MHIPVDAFSGRKRDGAYTGISTLSIYIYRGSVHVYAGWRGILVVSQTISVEQAIKSDVPEARRPLSLGSFNDGSVYALPKLQFTQTNLFSRIAYDGSVVVKLPSARGMSDYRKYIKNEQSDPEDIRGNEINEKFTQLDNTLNSLPELRSIRDQCGVDGEYEFTIPHFFEEMADDNLVFPDIERAIAHGHIRRRFTRDPRGTRYEVVGPSTDDRAIAVICRIKTTGKLLFITHLHWRRPDEAPTEYV
jgi:hypothetical protein